MVGGGVEKWAFCSSSLPSQKMVGVSDWTLVGLSYHAFAISGLLYMAIPPTLCKGWYGTLHWSPKGEIFCCRLLQSWETLPITTTESLKCPWEDHFLEKVPNIAITRFPLVSWFGCILWKWLHRCPDGENIFLVKEAQHWLNICSFTTVQTKKIIVGWEMSKIQPFTFANFLSP